MLLRATAACDFWTSDLQKVVQTCVFCAFWLTNVLRATAACDFWTSELPKSVPHWGFLYILTCKCASRHRGVPFFVPFFDMKMCHSGVPFLNIRTSKIGPSPRCFVHFAFKICFAPQRRAHVLYSSVCWTAASARAALARLLLEHQEAQIIEKTQRFATLLTFGACGSSF